MPERPDDHRAATTDAFRAPERSDGVTPAAFTLDDRDAQIRALIHDLRSPLAAISLRSQSLHRSAEGSDAALAAVAADLEADARGVLRLVAEFEHLLLDAGSAVPAPTTIDVAERVRLVVDAVPAGGRIVDVSRAPGDLRIDAHPFHFDRVVVNLVGNAVRHAPEGSVIEVTCSRRGDHVVVTVDDAGPGVPRSDRSRVFDAGRTSSDDALRTGLGLVIVRSFVEAWGGTVTVDDAPLGGARFVIEVPAASDADGSYGSDGPIDS